MRYLPFFSFSLFITNCETRSKCYSCYTTNMGPNFLTKQRGPPNRIGEPLVSDNNCQGDPWILKERSTVECDGPCYKWTQSLNNSGSFSSMTFRGCYEKLFNMADPNTVKPPNHSFCTIGEVPLTCLSDASVIEYSCWCEGDYCNTAETRIYSIVMMFSLLFSFYI